MSLIEVVGTSAEPEVDEMCKLYWSTDDSGAFLYTVKAIAERYSVTSNEVTKSVTASCRAYTIEPVCSTCGNGFRISSRSHFTELRRYQARSCAECAAAVKAEADREARRIADVRRLILQERFAVIAGDQLVVADLTLRSAMTIAALLRDDGCTSDGVITPMRNRVENLAPTSEFGLELVRDAWRAGLINIHPSAPHDAFGWKDDTPNTVTLELVPFFLRGTGLPDERLTDFMTQFELLVEVKSWPSSWHDELAPVWMEIAIAEATASLVFYLRQHKLEFSPGEGTRATIAKGFEWFTLGQMFNFIWRSAKEAAAYYSRERVPKNQAANSAVTRLRNSIERAYAEGWEVKPYRRDTRLGVSTLSQLLFTRSLRLSDPLAYNPILSYRTPLKLRWDALTDESFERLIFRLASEAEGYTDVDWLMKTNAPDHGRDVAATRVRHDTLSGYTHERIIIQCKHWLSRSIADNDVSKEVTSVDHWNNPPVDVLAIATSGKFTANAVSWVERHNAKGIRPRVEMWNDAKLETLLASKPQLILDFELR